MKVISCRQHAANALKAAGSIQKQARKPRLIMRPQNIGLSKISDAHLQVLERYPRMMKRCMRRQSEHRRKLVTARAMLTPQLLTRSKGRRHREEA